MAGPLASVGHPRQRKHQQLAVETNVTIDVAPFSGQTHVKLIIHQDDPAQPIIEMLLERHEALDLADDLQHAANAQ